MYFIVVDVVLTLTLLVKNQESVGTQRCWSPRKTSKPKSLDQNSSGMYYPFPSKNAQYEEGRKS